MTYTCTATEVAEVVVWFRDPPGNSNDGVLIEPPATQFSVTSTITFTQTTWNAALANNVDMLAVRCNSAFLLEDTFSITTSSPTYQILIVCKYKLSLL